MLFKDIFPLIEQTFGAANVISTWLKFPFSGLNSKYNILKVNIYIFIKFKTVTKGMIFVEKQRLEVDPFFCHFSDNF